MNRNFMENHPRKVYMRKAIEEAKRAAKEGQYALGAIIVCNNKIIAIEHTRLHEGNDPTAHAEINAIRKATQVNASITLEGCWLYSTQEPCPMCVAAAIWAKMKGIVYGASFKDTLRTYKQRKHEKFSWRQIKVPATYIIQRGIPRLILHKGFMHDECLKLYDLSR